MLKRLQLEWARNSQLETGALLIALGKLWPDLRGHAVVGRDAEVRDRKFKPAEQAGSGA